MAARFNLAAQIFAPITTDNDISNIALNKPVNASSAYSSHFPASNAVDGDNVSDSSRWISEVSTSGEHALEINLQGDFEVSRINFWTGWNGYNTPLAEFSVDYWSQGQWQQLFSKTNNAQAIVSQSFEPTVLSKIRLRSSNWIKLYEIEVLGTAYENTTNLALNKPVTSSSNYSEQYSAANAVDGNNSDDSSRWIAQDTQSNEYIEIDFEAEAEVSKVKFWTGWQQYNTPLVDYQLEYWDGSAWQPMVSRSNNTQAIVEESFSKVTTSKLRLVSDSWIKLFEIEVY